MKWLETLIAIAILGALIASWTLWSAALLRLRRGKPLLAYEPRKSVPWGAFDLFGVLAAMILLQLGALEALRASGVISSSKLEELTAGGRAALLLMHLATSVCTLGLAVLIARLRARATWLDLGVSIRHAPVDALLGLAGFFMLAPIVYLVMLALVTWFPYKHPLVELVKQDPDPRFFVLSAISAVVAAPIVEEILFRVLLQGWLEAVAVRIQRRSRQGSTGSAEPEAASRPAAESIPDPNPYAPPRAEPDQFSGVKSKDHPEEATDPSHATHEGPASAENAATLRGPPAWPILVSSLVFALLHVGHGPDPIPLFVLALGLGYLYRQTHRVLPGIVVHMLLNGVSMLVLLLSVYAGVGK